jgi:hypothetical protein
MKRQITIIALILNTLYSDGQNTSAKNGNNLFTEGIYLRDLELLLPWKIDFSKIDSYGKPTITKYAGILKNLYKVQWDSVLFLDRYRINLYINVGRRSLHKGLSSDIIGYYGTFDAMTTQHLIDYFAEYTGRSGLPSSKKQLHFRRWGIGKFRVTLEYKKNLLAIERIGT